MPLVTLTVRRPKTAAFKDTVLNSIHAALVATGVPQDDVQAYVWFALAAAGFSSDELEDGEDATGDRDKLAARMTSAQIEEARRLIEARLSAGSKPARKGGR